MRFLKSKTKKIESDKELSEEELDEVKAGVPKRKEWCPKVDVSEKNTDELTVEELDKITAGLPKIEERE